MTVTFPERFNLAQYFLFDRLGTPVEHKDAIRFGEHSYTYRQVADRAKAVAAILDGAGVQPEQRVYIVLPDVPPFAWALFGTLRRGSVVAMGNPSSPTEDLAYALEYTRAAALITTPEVAAALQPAIKASRHLRSVLTCAFASTGDDPEAPVPAVDGATPLAEAIRAHADMDGAFPTHRDDPAFWLFTSGSTGRAKAAVHSHRDFAFNTEVYAKGTVGYQTSDVTVSVPRLFFGYATGTNLLFPFAVGATTALFSERPTAERLTRAIADYKPTVVTNVPTMLGKILEHDDAERAEGRPGVAFGSVRFQLSAGEALPPSLLSRFTERFGGEVYDGIGSAEMFHIYLSNRPGDVKPGSLGRVVDGYELKILPSDAEGPGATEVALGEVGVLWVKGDSVAHGYFGDREKSWRTFHGHWCRTGDLFRRDEDGYYWFSGRADDLFKCGGIWVAPLEVEECLMQHDEVSMAAVVPALKDGLAKPYAFVVRREGSLLAEAELAVALQEHVKASLSKHKYPRDIEFVADLPKNDRGKVDKKALRARLA